MRKLDIAINRGLSELKEKHPDQFDEFFRNIKALSLVLELVDSKKDSTDEIGKLDGAYMANLIQAVLFDNGIQLSSIYARLDDSE